MNFRSEKQWDQAMESLIYGEQRSISGLASFTGSPSTLTLEYVLQPPNNLSVRLVHYHLYVPEGKPKFDVSVEGCHAPLKFTRSQYIQVSPVILLLVLVIS